ncbi:hypothetical protein THOM_3159 [Trachipleistophora hominis]|uniref:Uncharacterized protein n=1 Tax=Trachipleistophora hominis TaxID=72359 RepID=L7JR52_TRAHO|nr:hypothetical protein THOM_3159 [Trachipleistophora hominis]
MSTAQSQFPSYTAILHNIQALEERSNHPLNQHKLDILHAMLALAKLKHANDTIKVINDTAAKLLAVYERLCGNAKTPIERKDENVPVRKARSNPKTKYRKRAEELLRKKAQGRKVMLSTRTTRTNKFDK